MEKVINFKNWFIEIDIRPMIGLGVNILKNWVIIIIPFVQISIVKK